MREKLAEPTYHQPPTQVGPGTYEVHTVQHALGQPSSVYLNSMVIQAKEHVLVDTGNERNRRAWLEDTFGLVDPGDVRWVYISHDDHDHVGNLPEVMELCPKATLVCNWALMERLTNAYEFDMKRLRWANDGDSFDVGDRTLAVIRPPMYDSPTSRGLLDTSTGVYWAVDSFATPVPGGADATTLATNVADLDAEFWQQGMVMFGLNVLSPWLQLVAPERFAAEVDRVRSHGMTTVASAHSPTIGEDKLPEAWDRLLALCGVDAPPMPNQAVLDVLLEAAAAPAPA